MRFIVPIIMFSLLFGVDNVEEDFATLNNWKPLTFPKIERHTTYSIDENDSLTFLKAKTSGSASGIIFKESFNVYETPIVEWRWLVSNVFEEGNALEKSGDDYPIRIYIIFKYDPDKAGFFESAKYEAAKLIYDEYPPHSSLNYIWANREPKTDIIPNAYTNKAQMIALEWGSDYVGQWRNENVNLLEDYRMAFNEDPPAEASLAIMADSDNTGESATALIDYIRVLKK